ncbi:uncharacterized protein TM35_000391250 [Trypanosoma theileri]|uniref:Secreted protein n=1 Tax=Trypanosoma theileri TaxID=67003 RepID=A0A1X0NK30_9TRYP|nr:uncharacterized protein TM35_000391250 [Trypanosoma theileri]ORC84951.1 hypothetical protein TM35_000391250 [Trypanosoma theileri]
MLLCHCVSALCVAMWTVPPPSGMKGKTFHMGLRNRPLYEEKGEGSKPFLCPTSKTHVAKAAAETEKPRRKPLPRPFHIKLRKNKLAARGIRKNGKRQKAQRAGNKYSCRLFRPRHAITCFLGLPLICRGKRATKFKSANHIAHGFVWGVGVGFSPRRPKGALPAPTPAEKKKKKKPTLQCTPRFKTAEVPVRSVETCFLLRKFHLAVRCPNG